MTRIMTCLLVAIFAILVPAEASALITGGEGNEPRPDPGWPKGASVIFNHSNRVAWWEGPPFGGGQSHAEYRGDAKVLTAVLADFAKLDVKTKRVVIHDGAGRSFWLSAKRAPGQPEVSNRIDWVFMVWQPRNWEHLSNLPARVNPTGSKDTSPPSQIDVYTANIRWADVTVPKGLEVIDQRLETHGFKVTDGTVLEGRVTDLATSRPIVATVQLRRIEWQKTGGYLYPLIVETKTDADGHWVFKNVAKDWARVVVSADGFVPRVAGTAQFDGEPQWIDYRSGLARSTSVSGQVTDASGKPLTDAEVRLDDVVTESGDLYESALGYSFKTDAEGRFHTDQVPAGKATIWLRKDGYCRPGIGLSITTPKTDIALQMIRSSSIRVTVDFSGSKRPEGYIVEIEPEGGNAVGTYGGSGNIDKKNQMFFQTVPPGKYILKGHPNPSSENENTEPVTVELKGGESLEVKLKAK